MKYLGPGLLVAYQAVVLYTFVFLTFLDGVRYNWWNWFFIIPLNFVLAEMWPLYWGVLRWLF